MTNGTVRLTNGRHQRRAPRMHRRRPAHACSESFALSIPRSHRKFTCSSGKSHSAPLCRQYRASGQKCPTFAGILHGRCVPRGWRDPRMQKGHHLWRPLVTSLLAEREGFEPSRRGNRPTVFEGIISTDSLALPVAHPRVRHIPSKVSPAFSAREPPLLPG